MDEREIRPNRTRKKKRRRRKNSGFRRFLVIFVIAVAVIAAVLGISYAIGKHFANSYLVGENQQEVELDINSENTVAVEIPQASVFGRSGISQKGR